MVNVSVLREFANAMPSDHSRAALSSVYCNIYDLRVSSVEHKCFIGSVQAVVEAFESYLIGKGALCSWRRVEGETDLAELWLFTFDMRKARDKFFADFSARDCEPYPGGTGKWVSTQPFATPVADLFVDSILNSMTHPKSTRLQGEWQRCGDWWLRVGNTATSIHRYESFRPHFFVCNGSLHLQVVMTNKHCRRLSPSDIGLSLDCPLALAGPKVMSCTMIDWSSVYQGRHVSPQEFLDQRVSVEVVSPNVEGTSRCAASISDVKLLDMFVLTTPRLPVDRVLSSMSLAYREICVAEDSEFLPKHLAALLRSKPSLEPSIEFPSAKTPDPFSWEGYVLRYDPELDKLTNDQEGVDYSPARSPADALTSPYPVMTPESDFVDVDDEWKVSSSRRSISPVSKPPSKKRRRAKSSEPPKVSEQPLGTTSRAHTAATPPLASSLVKPASTSTPDSERTNPPVVSPASSAVVPPVPQTVIAPTTATISQPAQPHLQQKQHLQPAQHQQQQQQPILASGDLSLGDLTAIGDWWDDLDDGTSSGGQKDATAALSAVIAPGTATVLVSNSMDLSGASASVTLAAGAVVAENAAALTPNGVPTTVTPTVAASNNADVTGQPAVTTSATDSSTLTAIAPVYSTTTTTMSCSDTRPVPKQALHRPPSYAEPSDYMFDSRFEDSLSSSMPEYLPSSKQKRRRRVAYSLESFATLPSVKVNNHDASVADHVNNSADPKTKWTDSESSDSTDDSASEDEFKETAPGGSVDASTPMSNSDGQKAEGQASKQKRERNPAGESGPLEQDCSSHWTRLSHTFGELGIVGSDSKDFNSLKSRMLVSDSSRHPCNWPRGSRATAIAAVPSQKEIAPWCAQMLASIAQSMYDGVEDPSSRFGLLQRISWCVVRKLQKLSPNNSPFTVGKRPLRDFLLVEEPGDPWLERAFGLTDELEDVHSIFRLLRCDIPSLLASVFPLEKGGSEGSEVLIKPVTLHSWVTRYGDVEEKNSNPVEILRPPPVLVGINNGKWKDWLECQPQALQWWDRAQFEPFGGAKRVHCHVICPQAGTSSTGMSRVRQFIRDLSCVYEMARLGTHDLVENGLWSVNLNAEDKERDLLDDYAKCKLFEQRTSAIVDELCQRLRGVSSSAKPKDSACSYTVVYVVTTSTCDLSEEGAAEHSVEMEAGYLASLRPLYEIASELPQLNIVVQMIPLSQIVEPTGSVASLKDLAFSVYTKARPTIQTQSEATQMPLTRAYQPPFVLANPTYPEEFAEDFGAIMPDVLHACYSWSDDGRACVAVWTDSRGIALDSHVFLLTMYEEKVAKVEENQRMPALYCELFLDVYMHGMKMESRLCRTRMVICRFGHMPRLELNAWHNVLQGVAPSFCEMYANLDIPEPPYDVVGAKKASLEGATSPVLLEQRRSLDLPLRSVSVVSLLVDRGIQLASRSLDSLPPLDSVMCVPIVAPEANDSDPFVSSSPFFFPEVATTVLGNAESVVSRPIIAGFLSVPSTQSTSVDGRARCNLRTSLLSHFYNMDTSAFDGSVDRTHPWNLGDGSECHRSRLLLRAIMHQFHSLSWLTCTPRMGGRRESILPLHAAVLRRLMRLTSLTQIMPNCECH